MVEGGGLENRCAARYRGFESPLLRYKNPADFYIEVLHSKTSCLKTVGGFEPKRS